MNIDTAAQAKMARSFYVRSLGFILFWAAICFLPAGTFDYWQAWVVLAVIYIPVVAGYWFWSRKYPDIIERRSRMQEKQGAQQLIMKFVAISFLLTMLVPGFDRRFGWSHVSLPVTVLCQFLLAAGYGICFTAITQNRFAGRTVEVEQEQKVISSGLYGLVRHPMYFGALIMYLALPLALGSYWAFLPALVIIPVLAARIRNEEALLVQELPGYEEYRRKVKYRLVPGIW